MLIQRTGNFDKDEKRDNDGDLEVRACFGLLNVKLRECDCADCQEYCSFRIWVAWSFKDRRKTADLTATTTPSTCELPHMEIHWYASSPQASSQACCMMLLLLHAADWVTGSLVRA
jgi:hypothetical protein